FILRKAHFNALMNSLRDVFLLIAVSFSATAILPFTSLAFTGAYNVLFSASRPLPIWPTIWLGGALSALIVTPFLTRWIGNDLKERTRSQKIEAITAIILMGVLSYVLFAVAIPQVYGTTLLLLLLAVLFWISFRVGPRVMTLALLTLTTISI